MVPPPCGTAATGCDTELVECPVSTEDDLRECLRKDKAQRIMAKTKFEVTGSEPLEIAQDCTKIEGPAKIEIDAELRQQGPDSSEKVGLLISGNGVKVSGIEVHGAAGPGVKVTGELSELDAVEAYENGIGIELGLSATGAKIGSLTNDQIGSRSFVYSNRGSGLVVLAPNATVANLWSGTKPGSNSIADGNDGNGSEIDGDAVGATVGLYDRDADDECDIDGCQKNRGRGRVVASGNHLNGIAVYASSVAIANVHAGLDFEGEKKISNTLSGVYIYREAKDCRVGWGTDSINGRVVLSGNTQSGLESFGPRTMVANLLAGLSARPHGSENSEKRWTQIPNEEVGVELDISAVESYVGDPDMHDAGRVVLTGNRFAGLFSSAPETVIGNVVIGLDPKGEDQVYNEINDKLVGKNGDSAQVQVGSASSICRETSLPMFCALKYRRRANLILHLGSAMQCASFTLGSVDQGRRASYGKRRKGQPLGSARERERWPIDLIRPPPGRVGHVRAGVCHGKLLHRD